MESPTNPLLKVVDIAAVAAVARKHGVPLVVDNTFLSPYFQRPLALGASIVMHSISKYINGHSDVIGGVVCMDDDALHARIHFLQNGASSCCLVGCIFLSLFLCGSYGRCAVSVRFVPCLARSEDARAHA